MPYSFLETPVESRRIVQEDDGWWVYTEDMSKKLDGPFKTKGAAMKRLGQIEYFKHQEGKSLALPEGVEVRSLMIPDLELRVKSGPKGPMVAGYASVFGRDSQDLGGFIEQIHRNAFDQVIAKKADVRVLVNHDPNRILGRTASGTARLAVDDTGLSYEADLPDSPAGEDVARSIERGDISGSSFSFTTERDKWSWDATPARRLVEEVRDLFDLGPVTFPAYLDASAAIRSLDVARRAVPDPRIYRQRLHRLRLAFPSFAISKG